MSDDGRPDSGLHHLEDLRREASEHRLARAAGLPWRRRAARTLLEWARRLEPDPHSPRPRVPHRA